MRLSTGSAGGAGARGKAVQELEGHSSAAGPVAAAGARCSAGCDLQEHAAGHTLASGAAAADAEANESKAVTVGSEAEPNVLAVGSEEGDDA